MTNDAKNIKYLKALSSILHSNLLYSLSEEDANSVGEMYVYFSEKHKKDAQKTLVKRGKDNGKRI